MTGATDRAHVRLAELVGALSLGIDLGFGQPMEHVLRQCLIALRLAERIGLGEEERATVYYTALLVNVACHTDAHEQAKWFGDDIALKSTKYDYEFRSVKGAVAGMKRIGAGHRPLHRFRVGLEFVLSGHREVDNMIAHHAANARTLGEQLELPEVVLEALGGACQCPHWGYVLAGRMRYVYGDREETYEAGDAFYNPPGHRPYVEAGTELLQFSPTEALAQTELAIQTWMAQQQGG